MSPSAGHAIPTPPPWGSLPAGGAPRGGADGGHHHHHGGAQRGAQKGAIMGTPKWSISGLLDPLETTDGPKHYI